MFLAGVRRFSCNTKTGPASASAAAAIVAAVRRLLALVGSVVLVDGMLYAALAPLLPAYADAHGLSKLGAGLLVAAYAVGVFVAALPGGLAAARLGSKRAVLGGLVLMAAASVAFGLADGPVALGLARLAQGIASALSWAGAFAWVASVAPRERRGEMLGTVFGAAVVGVVLGPALGAVADLVGPRSAFTGVAVLAAGLFVWALRTPGAALDSPPPRVLGRAVRDPALLAGLWLTVLPALLFGVLVVLVPLELGSFGWSAAPIAAVFLAATGLEAVANPLLGRLSDRRGRLLPVRAALVASVGVSLALAWASQPAVVVALAIAAGVSYGGFWAPSMALISDAAERSALPQGLAFGLMNAGWATGMIAGPAAGGGLAELAGDALPYFVLAALSAATLAAIHLGLALGTRTLRVPRAS